MSEFLRYSCAQVLQQRGHQEIEFESVLELDDRGEPVNEKYAERRGATWLYRHCTGELPPGEPDLEPWERALY